MDDQAFRRAMGKFATGVTVVSAAVNGIVQGMTANAFMSISLRPPLIGVAVDEKANMHRVLASASQFAVNILSREQENISMHFAGQKKETKTIAFDWQFGVPTVKGALCAIVCDHYDAYKVGDHTIYIGHVKHLQIEEKKDPLTFFEGKYGGIGVE